MDLVPCTSCCRHHHADASACPFCRAGTPLRAALVAGVASAALSLSACYGAPPVRDRDGPPPEVAPVTSPADPGHPR